MNGHQLKSAHLQFLKAKVLPLLQADKNKKWRIYIEGRASRAGTEKYNYALSHLRAEQTFRYLRDRRGGDDRFAEVKWVGETRAALDGQKDGTENMLYRAVLITICSEEKQLPPTPIKIEPPSHQLNELHMLKKRYRIRLINAKSVTYTLPNLGAVQTVLQGGVSLDTYFFEIQDIEEHVSYVYSFKARGLTLGPSKTIKNFGESITFGGDWKPFIAPRGMAADCFSGPATLESFGASSGFKSWGKTNFYFGFSHWYTPVPQIKINDLPTGRTLGPPGAGITTTTGNMELLGRVAMSH